MDDVTLFPPVGTLIAYEEDQFHPELSRHRVGLVIRIDPKDETIDILCNARDLSEDWFNGNYDPFEFKNLKPIPPDEAAIIMPMIEAEIQRMIDDLRNASLAMRKPKLRTV